MSGEGAQTPMDALAVKQGRRTEAERRVCSHDGCPGDGRYQPPGRGHLPGCSHNAMTWTWEQINPGDRVSVGAEVLVEVITIPRPRIYTGPKHLTVDEATASYLREAAAQVRTQRYWGSGVSALVAGLLADAADAVDPGS